ncbi:MAG TPA: amidohydrolase [Gemmataceae bacterium]|nr:amidohydrolase [Gemmataceae bacterium]
MNSILLVLTMVPGADPAPPLAADLVLVGGKVWTVDREHPEAEAVAIWRDRIVKVGTSAEISALVGKKTQIIDLKGRRVVPGFHDSHLHFLGGGEQLARVELKDAKDEAEFGRRLQVFDKKLPKDRWMLGGNWDHDRTFLGNLPTAAIVDKYVPDRPVFIRRYDGHMALANSAALRMAKVTAETKEPAGGVIFKLADEKTPSGILKDNAMGLVDRVIPPPDETEIADGIRAAMRACAENGLTSVQDMDGSPAEIRRVLARSLQKLARDGQMTVRLDLHWPIASRNEVIGAGAEANFGNDFFRIGSVKGFMDGSLGSSTARMFEPYEAGGKNVGVFVTPPDAMAGMIREADKAGLSIAVHAIGDEANATLLDIFADAAKANGPRDRRFRIEHVQHLRPADYKRFKEIGVVASMQPYHAIDDGRWAEGRIGPRRCASSYAFRSFIDNGARLAFGSDWPVAPLDVLAGIDAAVNRRTLDGKHADGWFPEQRITVAEAVEAYTLGSAYGAFQDGDRGSIRAGNLADMVILSRDILASGERDKIADTRVETTIVGGRVVFERK